jgi:hypothetical protein
MTETESLALRHIRGAVDGLRDNMREVKSRLDILENQYASVSRTVSMLASSGLSNVSN